jgi:hypothetical protein
MSAEAEQVIIVRKVRAATVLKLLLFGLVISFVPLGVAFGVAGYFGADTVKWNNQPVHGVPALFAGPAVSLFVALLFTGFLGALSCLGLWLLSFVRPISIRFVPEPNKLLQPIAPTDGAPAEQ